MFRILLVLSSLQLGWAVPADAATAPLSVSVPRDLKALARMFPDQQGAVPLVIYTTKFERVDAILRDYTRARLGEEGRDPEELTNFDFIYDAQDWQLGVDAIGTLNKQAAFREVIDGIKRLYDGQVPAAASLRLQQRARDLMIELKDANVVFGFDASRENACNRTTTFMIFIDRRAHKIYGLDLDPCN